MRVEECVDKIDDVTIEIVVGIHFLRDHQSTLRIVFSSIFA